MLLAKNYTHAKASTILAGFLKILPLFTLVYPGVIARIIEPCKLAYMPETVLGLYNFESFGVGDLHKDCIIKRFSINVTHYS